MRSAERGARSEGSGASLFRFFRRKFLIGFDRKSLVMSVL